MPSDRPPGPPPLSAGATLARLAAIGAVVAAAAAAFLYAGGAFSPHRLTPDRMLAAVTAPKGPTPGFRRNHAKGVCATGIFESSGAGAALSKAALFKPGQVPLIGRFAFSGSLPYQADSPSAVLSLALSFRPVHGDEWRTGMIDLPQFPVNTVRGFYDLLTDTLPDPATGKPVPAKMQAFFAAHPEAGPALAAIGQRPLTSGFANATYNGIDAFLFVNDAGATVPVRWSAVPLQPFAAAPTPPPAGRDYLFDDLIAQAAKQKLQWHLILTEAAPGDPTATPAAAWPAGRQQVDAGTITIDKIAAEDGGTCTAINYDPMVLPAGIAVSDDPFPSARSATYSRSFTLRAGEAAEKQPSAVTPQAVQSGGKS
jgi:catalase